MELVVRKNFSKTPPVIERPPAEEGHGGGDQRLRDAIFRPELGARAKTPPYMALPGSRAGAMSCLTGIAARKSVQLGRAVKIGDLVKLGCRGSRTSLTPTPPAAGERANNPLGQLLLCSMSRIASRVPSGCCPLPGRGERVRVREVRLIQTDRPLPLRARNAAAPG